MATNYFSNEPQQTGPDEQLQQQQQQAQAQALLGETQQHGQLEFGQVRQLPLQQLLGVSLADVNTTATQPSTEKPYHSKRPHKKSRTGCRNCKARKVKCDESRPTCRSCRLRKAECVYPTPAASSAASPASSVTMTLDSPVNSSTFGRESSPDGFASPASTSLSRQTSPTPNDLSPVAQPLWHPGNIDAVDMKLLWFYTASTSASFSVAGPGSPVEDILKIRMVQVAFETPFLMDSLFALSSLHMQSLNQDCDPSRALAYRARSFEGYRRAVEEARPETYAALIANSLFLTALSSQVFREPDGKDLYILDWMIVWRGIGLVIDLMGVENVFHTGMYALFERPSIDLEKATANIPNHLLFMVSSIKPDDPDFENVKTYHETLKYLGSLYMNLRNGLDPVMGLRVITWFTFVPHRFVELGRRRMPRALVIIAYYAVFLKLIRSIWWIEGVGQRSLKDLCKFLSPTWEHLLHVPRAAMEVDDEQELVRVILQDPKWTPPSPTDHDLDPSSSIAIVDDAGRPLEWISDHNKFVVLNAADPSEPVIWERCRKEYRSRRLEDIRELIILLKRAVEKRDDVVISPQLYKRVVSAALSCMGFTTMQKDDLAFVSNTTPEVACRDFGQPLFADFWTHQYALVPKPGIPLDVIEWYIRLIREQSHRDLLARPLTERMVLQEKAKGTNPHWGYFWVEVGYTQGSQFDHMSLAQCAHYELSAIERILSRALSRA